MRFYNSIDLRGNTRNIELSTINSVAKYLRGFNDSLLVEDEISPKELRKLYKIFNGICK